MKRTSWLVLFTLLSCSCPFALAQLRFNPLPAAEVSTGSTYTVGASATFTAQSITVFITKNGSTFVSNGGGGSGSTPITVTASKATTDTATVNDVLITYDVTAQLFPNPSNQNHNISTITRIVAPNTPPTVTWTEQPPAQPNNPNVGQPFQLRARAQDADGNLNKLTLTDDVGRVIATFGGGDGFTSDSGIVPYTAPAPGIISFHATAEDFKGSTRATIQVKIGSANVLPWVLFNKEVSNAFVGVPFTFQARGGDGDGTLSAINVYRDLHDGRGALLVATTPEADVDFTPQAAGTITYSARAIDNLGGASETITAVVTVKALAKLGSTFSWGTVSAQSDPGSPSGASIVGTEGGAISVDSHGSANYTIPLKLPPGRAGMEPNLALSYSSGSGNGPLGTGWSLSTGWPQAITRGRTIAARDGATRGVNFDAGDKYYLDGKRLIRVGGSVEGQPGSTYRTEIDSFSTITTTGSGTNIETFVVADKSGRKFTFGKLGTAMDGYQKGEMDGETLAYAYALKRVEDALGNTCDLNYLEVINTVGKRYGEYVLREILYTANAGQSVTANCRVTLYYNTQEVEGAIERRDRTVSYISDRGFAHSRRLDSINVESGGARSGYYSLSYEYAGNAGRTRLYGVSSYLRNTSTAVFQRVPLTTITWSDSTLVAGPKMPYTLPSAESDEGYQRFAWGDFSGDGKDDYIDISNGIVVHRATGTGFVATDWMNSGNLPPPSPGSYGAVSVFVADINGDGKKDVILADIDFNLYALISTGTSFKGLNNESAPTLICSTNSIFQDPGQTGPSYQLRSVEKGAVGARITVADYSGDGRDDVLIHAYDGFLYLLRSQGNSFSPVKKSSTPGDPSNVATEYGWRYEIAGYVIYNFSIQPMPCDLNGDGLTDYVYVQTHHSTMSTDTSAYSVQKYFVYRIAKPDGDFTAKQEFNADTVGASIGQIDQESFAGFMLQGDYNGDGLPDFLFKRGGQTEANPDQRWRLLTNRGLQSNGLINFYSTFGAIPSLVATPSGVIPTWNRSVDSTAWTNLNFHHGPKNGSKMLGVASKLFQLAESGVGSNTFALDVNRDGFTDLVWHVWKNADGVSTSGRGWWVLYSNGDGFGNPTKLTGLPWDSVAPSPIRSGGDSLTWISIGNSSDVNGDGLPDFIVNRSTDVPNSSGLFGVFPKADSFGDLVTRVSDGMGRRTDLVYKAGKDDALYTPGAAAVSYPIREMRSSAPVVSDVYHDSGDGANPARFSYQYSGNYLDLSGRGSLGFHSFVTLDRETNVFKYQFLTQSFPMTGLASREQTYRYWEAAGQTNFRLISTHDNTVVFDEVINGPGGARFGTVYPFISKAVESRWEDATAAHFTLPHAKPAGTPDTRPEDLFPSARPAGSHITISAQSWFDEQALSGAPQTTLPGVAGYNPSDANGFPGTSTVSGTSSYSVFSTLPGKITFGNLRKLTTDFGDGFTETVTTSYLAAPSGTNLTGLVDTVSTSVTSTAFGTENAPAKKFTYSGSTPLVATEKVDASVATPASTTLSLTTTYERDTRGRVKDTKISSTDPTVGSYTVSSVSAFNDVFDLPTTVSDTYGHATTTVYDSVWGLPRTVTDVNGVQLSMAYDAFGRTTRQTRSVAGQSLSTDNTFSWNTADATDWTKTQTVSGAGGLSLSSVYAIRTTATVKPAVTAYYDRLGRQIRVVKEGYAGQTATTDTLYNKLGQVVAVSNPYADGDSVLWTTSTYDALGRVATVTAPVGTVTKNTYSGRSTTVEVSGFGGNGIAQTNTTVVDAKGRTVSVWNADNTSSTPSISFGLDGFGRMRTTSLKGQTQSISATYDALGRQLTLNDPDKGAWSYVNNALGQVVQQTDAKGTITATSYDRLGRPLGRTTTQTAGPVESAAWYYYDSMATVPNRVPLGSKGWNLALQREESSTTGASGYPATPTSTVYYYDNKGQPTIDLKTIDGKWFYTYTDYDTYGRVNQVRHYWRPGHHEAPADAPYVWRDFGYSYAYDSKSYLLSLTDSANRTWWAAEASSGYDHLDRPVLVQKGSAYWTRRSYRAADGVLTGIATGPRSGATVSPTVQSLSFGYDGLGNLTSRGDTLNARSETYGYDVLNRLTQLNSTTLVSYADNGNISWKKDVGGTQSPAYTYNTTKPHAVATAWGYTMGYDANGNMITRTGGGQTWKTGWAGFDKPRWLAKNNVGSEFHYSAARSRVMHLEFDQLTNDVPSRYTRKRIYALGSTMEVDYRYATIANVSSWKLDRVRIYVPGPEGIAGTMEFTTSAQFDRPEKALVYHYDHLGSIERVTPFGDTSVTAAPDEEGNPARYSYEVWGQRRNADTWSGAPTTTAKGGRTDVTPRGFTGHEMLDEIGLVHMNGRIYDPLLGRFLSADVLVDGVGNLQGYNRYSYVQNNPLSKTDPTGHSARALQGFFKLLLFGADEVAEGVVVNGGVAAHAAGTTAAAANGSMAHEPQYGLVTEYYFGIEMMRMARERAAAQQNNADQAQAADTKTKAEAQRQDTAPKPEVETQKPKEGTSGGQMDPNKDPKKDDKTKMAEVRAKGKEGESQQLKKIHTDGEITTGKQVTFESSKGTRAKIDATTTDGQKNIVREAKKGESATLSPGQKDLKADVEQGRPVIPRGQNAEKAGFTPGRPTILDEFKEDRFK